MFAAVTILMGLVCIGLTWDLGNFYWAQRDLQRSANLAALDAARATGGCLAVNPTNPLAAATAEAQASVLRNGGLASWVGSGVRVGRRSGDYSVRYFDPTLEDKNRAVEVTLTRATPGRLIPLLGAAGPATMSATAAAFSRPRARVSVGSTLVNISPPLLNSLLGDEFGPVNIDLVSYQNLFGANLPISSILAHLGVGTPEDIINNSVPVNTLLQAITAALGDAGQTGARAAAQTILSASAAAGSVLPANVLGVSDAGDFAANTVINAGDTIMALGALANGNALLNLPVALPAPLGPGSVNTSIIMPATAGTLAPGTDAGNASSYVYNSQGNVLVNLPLTVLGAQVTGLSMFVQVAPSHARVSRIECQRRGLTADSVWVIASSGISRIGFGKFDNINSPNPNIQPATLLDTTSIKVGFLTLPVKLTITIQGLIQVQSSEAEMPPFRGPFPVKGITQAINSEPGNQLANALTQLPGTLNVQVTADLLGVPLTPVINAVLAPMLDSVKSAVTSQLLDILNPASGNIADLLLNPIMQPLGLSIGTADVTVYDVVAEEPYLFTH